MMKEIYEAYDRVGMVRYVGMAFCNVHKRCISRESALVREQKRTGLRAS
jgi:hypothetical protein